MTEQPSGKDGPNSIGEVIGKGLSLEAPEDAFLELVRLYVEVKECCTEAIDCIQDYLDTSDKASEQDVLGPAYVAAQIGLQHAKTKLSEGIARLGRREANSHGKMTIGPSDYLEKAWKTLVGTETFLEGCVAINPAGDDIDWDGRRHALWLDRLALDALEEFFDKADLFWSTDSSSNADETTPDTEYDDATSSERNTAISKVESIDESVWLTTRQVAEHLGLKSTQSVRDRIRSGDLRAAKLGRGLRVRKRHVDEYMAERMVFSQHDQGTTEFARIRGRNCDGIGLEHSEEDAVSWDSPNEGGTVHSASQGTRRARESTSEAEDAGRGSKARGCSTGKGADDEESAQRGMRREGASAPGPWGLRAALAEEEVR